MVGACPAFIGGFCVYSDLGKAAGRLILQPIQISWPLVIIYLVVVLSIGVWAARTKVSTIEDMAVAGRRSGFWLIAFSVAATWINGVTLISMSGVGKDFGLGSYWSGGSFMAATIWAGYYMIPRLRQAQIVTVPQLFNRYFGPKTHLLALILTMLRDLGATAGVMGALAVVSSNLFQISIVQALFLTYILTLVSGLILLIINDLQPGNPEAPQCFWRISL